MIAALPKTPELLDVAKRVVWFKEPEKTLDNPVHFLAYLMTYCLPEDIRIVKKYLTLEDFKYALEHAPPGVFDARSWAYWNLVCHRDPMPPLPVRHLTMR
jgi:hypothetical protein